MADQHSGKLTQARNYDISRTSVRERIQRHVKLPAQPAQGHKSLAAQRHLNSHLQTKLRAMALGCSTFPSHTPHTEIATCVDLIGSQHAIVSTALDRRGTVLYPQSAYRWGELQDTLRAQGSVFTWTRSKASTSSVQGPTMWPHSNGTNGRQSHGRKYREVVEMAHHE